MIQIASSPTYTQQYYETQESENPLTFHYNVLGVRNLVNYVFRSLEAKIDNISQGTSSYALVTLRENITDYLTQTALAGGQTPVIYLDDNAAGTNYSGAYRAINIKTVSGVTQFYLMNVGNDAPTFFGAKQFGDDYTSQVVYRYRNTFTFQVYDKTAVGSSRRSVLLATVRQQMSAQGTVVFNVAEVVKGYTPPEGTLSIQVTASEKDYFGNEAEVQTDLINFVQAYADPANYGDWIMFNPNNGGRILDSTGRILYYDSGDGAYPFFLNYILNDELLDKENASLRIKLNFYREGNLLYTLFLAADIVVGLNSLDLSQYEEVSEALAQYAPDRIGASLMASYVTAGEFGSQFNSAEFRIASGSGFSRASQEYTFRALAYRLDNRRDFYFCFDNSIGGRSTMLCKQYKRQTAPEIVALRNRDTISNAVARETEYAELSFPYSDLDSLRTLYGYDLGKLGKDNGIYESRNVTRIGRYGDTKQWIIQSANYDLNNSDLYRTHSLTLYRPLFTGADTPVPARVRILDIDVFFTSATVNCVIDPRGNTVVERGLYLGSDKYVSKSNADAYSIILENLVLGRSYTVRAYAKTTTQEYRSAPQTFIAQTSGLIAYFDGKEHGSDNTHWIDLTGSPTMALTGFPAESTWTSGFVNDGLNVYGSDQTGLAARSQQTNGWDGFTITHLTHIPGDANLKAQDAITYIVGNRLIAVPLNDWTSDKWRAVFSHVADLKNKTWTVYLNGELLTQIPDPQLQIATLKNIVLGGGVVGEYQRYDGKIFAIMLHDYALSATRARNLYSYLSNRFPQ